MLSKKLLLSLILWAGLVAGSFFWGRSDARYPGDYPAGVTEPRGRQQAEASLDRLAAPSLGSDSQRQSLTLEAILALPSSLERDGLLYEAISELDSAEVERRIEGLRSQPPTPENRQLRNLLWNCLTRIDPLAAMEKARQLPASERRSALAMVRNYWASSDPVAFWDWNLAHEQDPQRRTMQMSSVFQQLGANGDIDGVLERYGSLSDVGQRYSTAFMAVRAIAAGAPERLPELLEKADSRERNHLLHAYAVTLVDTDPAGALAFATETEGLEVAIGNIITNWVLHGGISDAMAWADARAGTPAADQVRRALAPHLAQRDLAAALILLSEIQDESARVGGLSSIASSSSVDLEEVRTTIEVLPPGQARDTAMSSLARRISREQGRDRAVEYLQSAAGLSDTQRAEMIRRLPTPSPSIGPATP